MGKLILVRHVQSLWNLKNRFTGWTNVDLVPEGIEEARAINKLFKKNHINIDICLSFYLKRAIRTQWVILEKTLSRIWISDDLPISDSSFYGANLETVEELKIGAESFLSTFTEHMGNTAVKIVRHTNIPLLIIPTKGQGFNLGRVKLNLMGRKTKIIITIHLVALAWMTVNYGYPQEAGYRFGK